MFTLLSDLKRGNSLNDDESCKNWGRREREKRGEEGRGEERGNRKRSRFLTTRQNLRKRKINTTSHESEENASEKSWTVRRLTNLSYQAKETSRSALSLSVPCAALQAVALVISHGWGVEEEEHLSGTLIKQSERGNMSSGGTELIIWC